MRCECGGKERIYETRMRDGKLHRRRKCDDCRAEYWTVEVRLGSAHLEEERIRKAEEKILQRIKDNELALRSLRGNHSEANGADCNIGE